MAVSPALAVEDEAQHRLAAARVPPTDYYPVALATSLIADRWSLLIVHKLSFGASGFNEVLRALPGLSRSLLSTRLRHLQRIGVVIRGGSNAASSLYALTKAGEGLLPVLETLGNWAVEHHMLRSSNEQHNAAALLLWRMHQSIEPTAVPNGKVNILVVFQGSTVGCGWVQIGVTSTGSWSLGIPEQEVDLTVKAPLEVLNDLWWGRLPCEKAIAKGDISFEGPTGLARSYRSWFPHRPAISGPGRDTATQVV